jgi:hypothetical protein
MAAIAWAWQRARTGLYARLQPEVPTEVPRLPPTPERAADAHSANPGPCKAA